MTLLLLDNISKKHIRIIEFNIKEGPIEMAKNLMKIVIIFIPILFYSCLEGTETSSASYVTTINFEELTGQWKFSTTFRNKKMVKRFKPDYLELSKTEFDLRLNTDNSVDIQKKNDPEIKSLGSWELIKDSHKFTNLETTWIEFDFENDYKILSGKYYLTQTKDSIFMFKKIWENFDSSGALKFKKEK